MEVLAFTVINKEIECDIKQVVGDNDYQASFMLDNEWNDKEVICRVVWNNRTSLDIALEDLSCVIPAYIMKRGEVSIGVYAEGDEQLTTEPWLLSVRKSIREKEFETAMPHKEIWNEINEKIKNVITNNDLDEKVVLSLNDAIEKSGLVKNDELSTEINTYLGEEQNVLNLGLATLKNALAYINVTFLGVDNAGAKDNADLLQTIIDSVPSGTTLYFPTGVYLLSKGITINKSIQLIGDRKGRYLAMKDDAKQYGSCLKFIDNVSSATMITQGENCWSLVMRNLILHGNSGNYYDDGLNDETIPYAQYRYEVINENVNGLNCIHSSTIDDCSFCFFSGYGLSNSQAQNITNCKFYGNRIGVYVDTNDIMLRDCYITAGEVGIYCVDSKNVLIHDCYIDLLSEYGIYCEGYLSGYISGYIDHTNYSGIHANVINNLIVHANIYRTGMYNSGLALEDLLVSDSATNELENFKKACAVSCEKMFKSTLTLGANSRPNDDASTSSKTSPVVAVYATQSSASVLIGAEIDVQIRVYNTPDALTLIGSKGVIRYGNTFKRVTPSLIEKTWSPSASHKAQNIGDMWYNSYKKEWYVATAITDTSTTWERQYTTTEIADIISRLEALENASATTE